MAEHETRSEVNLRDEIYKKKTLLHKFASKGLTDIVNTLLKAGADINAEDENKKIPLHRSVESGHKDVVEILLKAGANVNAEDENKKTPLHSCIERRHVDVAVILLKAGANINAEDEKKRTPLHCCVASGHKDVVEILLKAGANINAEDDNKKTPLHYSVESGHKDVVEILLKAKANVNAQNNRQVAPLHVAVYRGYTEIVETLLRAGANANAANDAKITPLHKAASCGYTEIVETLLKAGASVNAECNKKCSPLHYAAGKGNKEIVTSLLKAGANVNAEGDNKWTPLHAAAYRGDIEIVETLLKAGANANAADDKKMTPLQYAAWNGNKEIVTSLLKAGANVNAENDRKLTPLHGAAEKGYKNIVETLLKAGANVNADCDHRHTPLFYSNRECHHEVSKCLLKSGATEGQGVWRRFINHVSSALAIKSASRTKSAKTVHVPSKSTDGVSSHSEYSYTSIMTWKPKDGHTDVTPGTAFDIVEVDNSDLYNMRSPEQGNPKRESEYKNYSEVTPTITSATSVPLKMRNHTQLGLRSADCVTLGLFDRTANSCTVISDDTESTTSAFSLGLCFEEREDLIKQVDEKSSTDETSVIKKGKIIDTFPTSIKAVKEEERWEHHSQIWYKREGTTTTTIKGVQNYTPKSFHVNHPEFLTVDSRVKLYCDADTDDRPSNKDGLEDYFEDIQQGSSSADCSTHPSTGSTTANSCIIFNDGTEATTSALPLGLSLQECEDIRKQVEDHWAKFSLQHKSNKAQCSTDVTSVLKDGNITINICPKTMNDLHNYSQESLHDSHPEYLTVNSRVDFGCTEPADSYINSCDNVLE